MSFNELLSLFSGVLGNLGPIWSGIKLAYYFAEPLLYFYGACALFFGLYVVAVQLYMLHLHKKLPLAAYVLGAPFVAAMLVVDVFFQYTLFSLLYREWPAKKEWTVTQRLSRWGRTDPDSLRGRWSANICKMLNLFSPFEKHCIDITK